jgi:hypothetical protein
LKQKDEEKKKENKKGKGIKENKSIIKDGK